jgi:hypothetical protein
MNKRKVGRPCAPGTDEEREQARREKVRAYVAAHRQRKKEATSTRGSTSLKSETKPVQLVLRWVSPDAAGNFAKDESQRRLIGEAKNPSQQAGILVTTQSRRRKSKGYDSNSSTPSPVRTDFAQFSAMAPTDLSFGLLPALAHDVLSKMTDYPVAGVMAVSKSCLNDQIMKKMFLAVGLAFRSSAVDDKPGAAMARQAYDVTIQCLKTRLQSTQIKDPLAVLTVMNGLTAVEVCAFNSDKKYK